MNQHYSQPGFRLGSVTMWVLLAGFPLLGGFDLDVQCSDQGGTPLAGVKVSVQHLNSQKVREKKSDAKGRANFNKLEDGVYRVLGAQRGLRTRVPRIHSSQGFRPAVGHAPVQAGRGPEAALL